MHDFKARQLLRNLRGSDLPTTRRGVQHVYGFADLEPGDRITRQVEEREDQRRVSVQVSSALSRWRKRLSEDQRREQEWHVVSVGRRVVAFRVR